MNRTEIKRQRQREKRLASEPKILRFAYDPNILRFAGPIITTDVWLSKAQIEALRAAGQPVPKAVSCRFLIDSGAYSTIVKHQFAEQAQLKLINTNSPLRGIGEDRTGKTYIGTILFGLQSQVSPTVRHIIGVQTEITGAELPHADHFDGLIGRDVLNFFDLRYNGQTGEVTMKFIGPTDKALEPPILKST